MRDRPNLKAALEALAEQHDSATALQDGPYGQQVSFAALQALSEELAGKLSDLCIPTDRVVAYAADTPFAAALMVLAFAPHVTAAPIRAQVTEAEALALLAAIAPAAVVLERPGTAIARAARDLSIPMLLADTGASGLGLTPAAPDFAPAQGRQIDGQGIILTTSGTTGTPKLVALEAQRLVAGGQNVARTLALTPQDTGLEVMPLYHIHGIVAGLLAPLLAGTRSVVQPTPEPGAFLEAAAALSATWFTAVPTMHRAIWRAAQQAPALAASCNLRLARSSSSAMPAEVRAGIQRIFDCPVVEAYGMTEATHQISSQSPFEAQIHGTVGKPEPGSVRICTPQGHPLATGAQGEVLVRRETIIDSYLDNPQANAATFIDGWMRTGDIGRLDQDGTLTLIGRDKEIIKRGGAQVPPVEVEDALQRLEGVTDAIVFGVDHPSLGQDVAAAVVLQDPADDSLTRLRAALL